MCDLILRYIYRERDLSLCWNNTIYINQAFQKYNEEVLTIKSATIKSLFKFFNLIRNKVFSKKFVLADVVVAFVMLLNFNKILLWFFKF